MKKFRLPRKKKKQYKKDNIVFNSDWRQPYRVINWLWFYQKEKVLARNMVTAGLDNKNYEHLKKHHNIWKWK